MTARRDSKAGDGVDASDGSPVDPTRNVLDLVEAEGEKRDLLREADDKFQNAMRDANDRRQDDLAAARSEGNAALTAIKEACDHRIADMQQKQVDNLAILRSGQLHDLASRITQLENKNWESVGKASVSDPAMAVAMKEMTSTLRDIQGTGSAGRNQVIAWVIAGIGFMIGIVGAITAILNYARP